MATEMGGPNVLSVTYSTSLGLPLEGPVFYRHSMNCIANAYWSLVDFVELTERAKKYIQSGGAIRLARESAPGRGPQNLTSLAPPAARITAASTNPLCRIVAALMSFFGRPHSMGVEQKDDPTRRFIEGRLSRPDLVTHLALDSGLLTGDATVLAEDYAALSINDRFSALLEKIVERTDAHIPREITEEMTRFIDASIALAQTRKQRSSLEGHVRNSPETRPLLTRCLAGLYQQTIYRFKSPSLAIGQTLFPIAPSETEWALWHIERLELEFGTPTIRGPVMSEAVPAQGLHRREDTSTTQELLQNVASESNLVQSTQLRSIDVASLGRILSSIHSPGHDSADNLLARGGQTVHDEERRSLFRSYLRHVSAENETMTTTEVTRGVLTKVAYEIPGVDEKLACSHHRYKVVVPVAARIFLTDVGLTWCPRLINPFMGLRNASETIYDRAHSEYMSQYYVPAPVWPTEVYETIVVRKQFPLEQDNDRDTNYCVIDAVRTIELESVEELNETPDLDAATVSWEQDRGFWNDDPDTYAIYLTNKSWAGSTIRFTIHLETNDRYADFKGVATVEVPVRRYTRETAEAIRRFEEGEHDDQEMSEQELVAQAAEYARDRRDELIEKYEDRRSINRLLFKSLVKQSLDTDHLESYSYYEEVLSRCVNWQDAKVEYESCEATDIAYPEYLSDHFMNSPGARFFLPIRRRSEAVFVDTLRNCGNLVVADSVERVVERVSEMRDSYDTDGPEMVDEFEEEVIIGDHLESVLSEHESAS